MKMAFAVNQEEVRRVVKRVLERSATRQPIAYPRYDNEEGPPAPINDEEKRKPATPSQK